MILNNGGIAVDISKVKAIKTEFLKQGGNLVFEFDNFVILVENPDTEELELRSFPNNAVEYYIETSDSLRVIFDEWVELWEKFRK